MRRFLLNRIMETSISKIRPASPPPVSLQPLDKKPRVTPPDPALHARVKLTAPKRSKRRKHTPPELGSPEDVISREVVGLLGNQVVARAEADGVEWESPFGFREEVELTVSTISSSGMSYFKVIANEQLFIPSSIHWRRPDLIGEGLAIAPSSERPWVVVVPFTLPGEIVRARVYRHARMYSFADLISIQAPNPELRDMSRVQCKYFGTCAGCQYQVRIFPSNMLRPIVMPIIYA